MPYFNTNEWAILALVLVAGWLLGLLSRSGGGKWRRKYEDERDNHVALRRDYDAYLARHRETVVDDGRIVDDRRTVHDRRLNDIGVVGDRRTEEDRRHRDEGDLPPGRRL